MGKVGTVNEFWPHTFQVDIPTLINFTRPKVRYHNSTSSLCHTIRNPGEKTVGMRLNYVRQFQETLDSAIKFMPTSRETHCRSRSKHSPLHFIGYQSQTFQHSYRQGGEMVSWLLILNFLRHMAKEQMKLSIFFSQPSFLHISLKRLPFWFLTQHIC